MFTFSLVFDLPEGTETPEKCEALLASAVTHVEELQAQGMVVHVGQFKNQNRGTDLLEIIKSKKIGNGAAIGGLPPSVPTAAPLNAATQEEPPPEPPADPKPTETKASDAKPGDPKTPGSKGGDPNKVS